MLWKLTVKKMKNDDIHWLVAMCVLMDVIIIMPVQLRVERSCSKWYVKVDQWCFHFHLKEKSLKDTMDVCRKNNGNLVKIDSSQKEGAMLRYMNDKNFYKHRLRRRVAWHSFNWLKHTRHEEQLFCKYYIRYGLPEIINRFCIPNGKIPGNHNKKDRANYTTPSGFSIKLSTIPDGGLGAWTDIPLPKFLCIGEYEGEEHTESHREPSYSWIVENATQAEKTHYVDAISTSSSNWLRYVNCPRSFDEENLKAVHCAGMVFYMTAKDIKPGTELLVWYGGPERFGKTRQHPDEELDFVKTFYIRVAIKGKIADNKIVYSKKNIRKHSTLKLDNQSSMPTSDLQEIGVLLAFNGTDWNLGYENDYSYFLGRDGLKLPFICEEDRN